MQRVKTPSPMRSRFIPAGKTATADVESIRRSGLSKAGVKLIGRATSHDEELENMGDAALGVLTVHHYSAAATRPANQASSPA